MPRSFAYVLYNEKKDLYFSPSGEAVQFLEHARFFEDINEAINSAPPGSWVPVKVLLHLRNGRVIDVELWED